MTSPLRPSTAKFNFKRITDPVHGTIGLSELEVHLINEAKVFKRLRNIKQLGLAHFVFPGADYSRFSHSVGVCHITGRIIGSLRSTGVDISDDEMQSFRLAGLFHDLGHYPFSHTMEDALKDVWSRRTIKAKDDPGLQSLDTAEEPPFEHEPLGLEILDKDPEIRSIFERYSQDATREQVSEILSKVNPNIRLATLISSDLDADRLDYLLRNSHHTGLPYGSIDLSHLLSEMRLDSSGRLCLRSKALRTADHLFLGRYFDYQQIAFNKTVKAAELVLQDVIAELLKHNLIDVSHDAVVRKIKQQTWSTFDDSHIIERILELRSITTSDSVKLKTDAILFRKPPKLVGEMELIQHLAEDENKSNEFFQDKLSNVRGKLAKWVEDFEIPEELWYLWIKKGMKLTKIGSVRLLDDLSDDGADNKAKDGSELARILYDSSKSKPIVQMPYSIMSVMSNYGFYALRIYVLFPEEKKHLRTKISTRIREDINSEYWKPMGSASA